MAGYGDKPFGLREIILYEANGATGVSLPRSMMFHFTPVIRSFTARVQGIEVGAASLLTSLEWEIEAGGISLEAYAKLTGLTLSTTGVTPNRITTLSQAAMDSYPYLQIHGRAISDSGQARIRLYRTKLVAIEGTFRSNEFVVTYAKGVAIHNGTLIFDVSQQESVAAL